MDGTKDISRLTRYIIAAAVIAIIVFLVWYFSNIVTYILVAAVVAIIGHPLNRLISGTLKLPRWAAAIITLLVIWGAAIAFFYFFTPLIFNKIKELSQLDISQFTASFNEPLSKLNSFLAEYFAVNTSNISISETMAQFMSRVLNLNKMGDILTSVVSFIADTALGLFSVTFICFFFLKEEGLFFKMVAALFPSKYEQNIDRALTSVSYLLSRYFVGLVAEMVIMMLMVSGGLILCGFAVGDAFFIGLIVGTLKVIPYLGAWIGLAISLFVGAASTMGVIPFPNMVAMICGSILVAEMIDNFIVQPVLYSKQVKAHPLEIFIVILIGSSVGGVVGMLIAIPSYTVLRVFAKEFFNHFALVRKLTENLPTGNEEELKHAGKKHEKQQAADKD